MNNFAPEDAKGMWDLFSEYECTYGDLTSIQRIEKRLQTAFPRGEATECCWEGAKSRWGGWGRNAAGSMGRQGPILGHRHCPRARVGHGSYVAAVEREGWSGSPDDGWWEWGRAEMESKEEARQERHGPPVSECREMRSFRGGRQHVLESCHPERFARPNFTRWTGYKPTPEEIQAEAALAAHEDRSCHPCS